ncbi:uncharacterized protein LOC129763961 [Toxorhynchites rutilus septentrionalis]|uniref:uncharacterized protein LOC129763961 n=1 Tax=Toxorhynchites rutilus septentrionalis TaxID=329112 RepID=UPI0024783AB6|nr:uncharacterized protein LOC129763961 [Toxorhynchites rutilus septentrionalis]
MRRWNLLVVLVTAFYCAHREARTQSGEGDSCFFQNTAGICVGYSSCRRVLESTGSRITICSYNAKEAIVCCPEDYKTRLEQQEARDASMTISARKCEQYMRQAAPTLYFSSLKPNGEVIQRKARPCPTYTNLIVGGEAAQQGEFPHMAAIGYRSGPTGALEFRCGGSLISERFILTAAHCRNEDAVLVRLGVVDLLSDKSATQPQDYNIESFIRHPEYSARTKHNDIALVELSETVPFSQRVRPACLYQSTVIREQKLTATGYGAVDNFGTSQNHLLKVVLDQYGQEECRRHYQSDVHTLTRNVVDTQMCAGYPAGGRDTCQGDSGGPLQVRNTSDGCQFHIVAVTSFGKFCGTIVPAIYTRIAPYLSWIESIVWNSATSHKLHLIQQENRGNIGIIFFRVNGLLTPREIRIHTFHTKLRAVGQRNYICAPHMYKTVQVQVKSVDSEAVATMDLTGLLQFTLFFAILRLATADDRETAARIASWKCQEYVDMVSEPHEIITLDLDSPVRYIYSLQCPLQNPYVVGGKAVQKHEFPHMVALGYQGLSNYDFLCGGSLISEQFVLTAAHCITDKLKIVRIGVVELDDPDALDIKIAEIIIHSDYSPLTKYDDITLLRLEQNVTISLHIRPACLGTDRTEQIRRATVTGWGKTSPSSRTSNELNKVSLDIPSDRRKCIQMYNAPGRSRLIDRQICAGSLEGRQDACQGDSGGPLQVFEEGKCRYHVIGVVSFGKICGSAEYGVYTRVSRYLSWIVETVWPDEWEFKEQHDLDLLIIIIRDSRSFCGNPQQSLASAKQIMISRCRFLWHIQTSCLLLLFFWLHRSEAALQEYDACRYNGAPGICRSYSACKKQLQNKRITICSYNAREAVVCCPEAEGVRFEDNDEDSNKEVPQSPDLNSRKAVQKCKEYSKLSYNQIAVSTLTLTPTVLKYDVPKCDNIVKLIVGGNITKPGEFPHMAAIGWRYADRVSFDCGGSLISDRFVLTACHCYLDIDGEFPSFVRLGEQNLVRDDDGANPIDVDIEEFLRHPEFKRSRGLYNDVALIKLVRKITFTNYIRPACLFDQFRVSAEQAIATGFGLKDDHGDKSDELLKVSLNIYGNDFCQKAYTNIRQLKSGFKETQLCAGNTEGGKDTCQGDSGGPLQITKQENHCMFHIVGITSFGQSCGSSVPAVYTRVASYLDWIESVVWT